jgi:hypothetical protein
MATHCNRHCSATQGHQQSNITNDQPIDTHGQTTNTRSRIGCTTQQPEANAPEDGKTFDFNISSSKSDESVQPACQPYRRTQDATIGAGSTEVDQHINDPTPAQDLRKAAANTCHFFERQGDNDICKVCK